MKKKILFLTPFIFLLGACGTPSVDDLIEDQELLAEITVECTTMMMQGKDTNTEECKNAQLATKKMTENMMKAMKAQMGQ